MDKSNIKKIKKLQKEHCKHFNRIEEIHKELDKLWREELSNRG